MKKIILSYIKNIYKKFNQEEVLHNLNYSIPKGKIIGLIGSNGAGKTTLFNIFSGIISPEKGDIFFESESILKKNIETIANKGVSRSFQDSKLFQNLTVKENLLLAMSNDDQKLFNNLFLNFKYSKEHQKKVKELLELIEFQDIEHKYVKELSWGQKKLIEFLRTIAKPHKILLLDEPAAGIIPIYRQEKIGKMLKLLKKKGETILLIDHDLSFTFAFSDRVIFMARGKVVAEGTPNQIKKNKLVIDTYIGK